MTTIHLRKPFLLCGGVSVLLAALAIETSAQARAALESPLSHAVGKALRSPFHSYYAPPGSPGRGLVPSSTASPLELPGLVGVGASPAPQSPGNPIAAAGTAPSDGKVFFSAAIAAAVGYFGTFYLAELCVSEPGRYDGGSHLWGAPGSEEARIPCPVEDGDDVVWMGFLATIPVTAAGATLAGSGFTRSLLGSALGFAGGMGALFAIWQIGDPFQVDGDFEMSEQASAVVLSLAHAAVTTLFAN